MDKLGRFIAQLNADNFAGAEKTEAEIIDEECKNSGICMNFLKCTTSQDPKIGRARGDEWRKMTSSIEDNIPCPKFAEYPTCYYKNFEKKIADELNKFLDEAFLSILNEKILLIKEKQLTCDTLRKQMAKMPEGLYCAVRKAEEIRRLNPNWKEENAKLNNEYAGLYNIRNFPSPNVPWGEIYLMNFPLGSATIYRKVDINQSQNCNFPISVVINCSVDINLNSRIDAVRLKRIP